MKTLKNDQRQFTTFQIRQKAGIENLHQYKTQSLNFKHFLKAHLWSFNSVQHRQTKNDSAELIQSFRLCSYEFQAPDIHRPNRLTVVVDDRFRS